MVNSPHFAFLNLTGLLYPPAGLDGLVVAPFQILATSHSPAFRISLASACLTALLLDPKETSL